MRVTTIRIQDVRRNYLIELQGDLADDVLDVLSVEIDANPDWEEVLT